MGQIKNLQLEVDPVIQIREGLDISAYKGKTLTFGCGHQASICKSKQDETTDAHSDELTINLTSDIAPDIQADFRNPDLYKLFPDNHFKRIWFELMHIGENFSTKSLQECFRMLEPGGQLEIGDDTVARLVKNLLLRCREIFKRNRIFKGRFADC
ncbi:MAG: class I SAM-dependent methyltransferase [Parachlamydiaceae bacterium]|nr:MAG: class I SAM-dependent methyltransferase [Parachlamydiaceae bacterium]